MAGSFGTPRQTPSRNQGGIMGPAGSNVNPTYKNQGTSIASKIKKIFEEKPKYTSEVIVWNKKMDAAEAARKRNK